MAQISTYSNVSSPDISDKLIGTDVENENVTKNFTISTILALLSSASISLPEYASNDLAVSGGLLAGQLYRNEGVAGASSIVCVVY